MDVSMCQWRRRFVSSSSYCALHEVKCIGCDNNEKNQRFGCNELHGIHHFSMNYGDTLKPPTMHIFSTTPTVLNLENKFMF